MKQMFAKMKDIGNWSTLKIMDRVRGRRSTVKNICSIVLVDWVTTHANHATRHLAHLHRLYL